ncbi:uncharacterized protein LOC141852761 [Brevipalpus obovatus]|uniref:uncharacterized protein LOC141852761 n=1 Tax=Brevipalpus obovatus TaxID=246614 RepID=UPI003D9E75E0
MLQNPMSIMGSVDDMCHFQSSIFREGREFLLSYASAEIWLSAFVSIYILLFIFLTKFQDSSKPHEKVPEVSLLENEIEDLKEEHAELDPESDDYEKQCEIILKDLDKLKRELRVRRRDQIKDPISGKHQSSRGYWYFFLSLLPILIPLSTYSCCKYFQPGCSSSLEKELDPFFIKHQKVLPDSSQRVIRASLRSVLDYSHPSSPNEEPSVLLLIGSFDNAPNVKKLVVELSVLVSRIQCKRSPPVIEGDKLESFEVHENFTRILGSQDYNSIVLNGLERVRGSVAQSLHRFTDHDGATFKNVVILLSAYTTQTFRNRDISFKRMDEIANQLLETAWKNDLPEDHILPLLSRLTPSVAIVLDQE